MEPRARFGGHDAIAARIGSFAASYGWMIGDPGGTELLRGIDFIERAADGRLRRVVTFFGELKST